MILTLNFFHSQLKQHQEENTVVFCSCCTYVSGKMFLRGPFSVPIVKSNKPKIWQKLEIWYHPVSNGFVTGVILGFRHLNFILGFIIGFILLHMVWNVSHLKYDQYFSQRQ